MIRRRSERGYAMVAAVAGMAAMAVIAATFARHTTSRIDTLDAEATRAQLSAAADAGVAMALDGLLAREPDTPWSIDGSEVHHAAIDGMTLDIHVEDELGKVLVNAIDDSKMGHFLDLLGVDPAQAAIARDSFADWLDSDDNPRENGAESGYYGPLGIIARGDGPHTVDELGDIRGFTPAMVAKIAAYATADAGTDSGSFHGQTADPIAIEVMNEAAANSPDVISRRRAMAGQRVAIDLAANGTAARKAVVTVVVTAHDPAGASATRRALVELTGLPRQPYVVRWAR